MELNKEVLIGKKIHIKELEQIIIEEPKIIDNILSKDRITIEIYKIIPLTVLTSLDYGKPNGISKIDIFYKIIEEIKDTFRRLDPYNEKGIWGIFLDDLYINHIIFYRNLGKISVSIS